MNQTPEASAQALAIPSVASALPEVHADAVTTISPTDRLRLPGPPDSGFIREACTDDGHVWTGFASTEPGTASPWHHHGDYTTYVLPLKGEGIIEFGDGRKIELRPNGTVVVVPPGLVHREVNTGATRNEAFLVRVGSGPAVVPAEAPRGS